ncbi:hypothetical protein [Eikenella sp. Marseille-P7795]|uniref:hypothetical protein n=1 Tax=Eikenella sp. Marseille-P7795 TaxID=2866577 RepID=UPI001CE4A047|nr:hypothetical protein [Eikenella sp. Marseille-P7795]
MALLRQRDGAPMDGALFLRLVLGEAEAAAAYFPAGGRMEFQAESKFQVAFAIYTLFTLAPHAGAGTSFSLLRQRKGSKRKTTAGTGLLRKLPSLHAIFRAGSQLAAAPLRTCKPLFPEKPRSVRLRQQGQHNTAHLWYMLYLGVWGWRGYLKVLV